MPFYLLLLTLTAVKYKIKTLYIGIFLGLLLLIGDRSSVMFFKDVFERLRPCHNPELANLVHTINDKCGGQYGFLSSHATNSFALAIFTGLLFKKHYKYIMILMLIWAAVVSYSRVYVGVHYPADILCGAILGVIVGFLVFWLMKVTNKRFNLKIDL